VSSKAEVGDGEDNQEEEGRIHRTLFLQPNLLPLEFFLLRFDFRLQLLLGVLFVLVALLFLLEVFVVPVALLT